MSVLYSAAATGETSMDPVGNSIVGLSEKFTGDGTDLLSVAVQMRVSAPSGQPITCKVFAADAGGLPTGPALATASNQFPDTALPSTPAATFTYTFNGFTPLNGVNYCFVLNFDDLGSGTALFIGSLAGSDGGKFDTFSWSELGLNLAGIVSAGIPDMTRGLPGNRRYYAKTFGAGGIRE